MTQAELPQGSMPLAPDLGAAWLAAMAAGDFAAAWAVSDIVLRGRSPTERDDPAQPYHLRTVWDGTPPDGRRTLVRCYHGLGDTLQFARFLPTLRRRAAGLTLEAQPALLPLLAGCADRLHPFDPAAPLPPAPCTLEIMELSHALRLAPDLAPYLRLPPAGDLQKPSPAGGRGLGEGGSRVPALRREGHPHPGPLPPAGEGETDGPLPGGEDGALRIGLCWQVTTGWRPERSLPVDLLLHALPPGLRLQSLQLGQAPAGLRPCPDRLVDTARLVAGLDAVVTVDTMVAHLAGALGVPVFLLLDSAPDWRWLAGGRGSPWYGSIRKYGQAPGDGWAPALGALRADLTGCVRAGTVQL